MLGLGRHVWEMRTMKGLGNSVQVGGAHCHPLVRGAAVWFRDALGCQTHELLQHSPPPRNGMS